MTLTILSLKGSVFKGEARALTVKTTSGEITVLDHHRPLITALKEGIAVITLADGEQQKLTIHSGFLEVDSYNYVTALMN